MDRTRAVRPPDGTNILIFLGVEQLADRCSNIGTPCVTSIRPGRARIICWRNPKEKTMPILELAQRKNLLHRKSDAQTILEHTLDDVRVGRIALVSSFGADSVVLLHMMSRIRDTTPVIFVDTRMLFHETLTYQKEVAHRLGLKDIRVVTPKPSALVARDANGRLHRSNPDACCALRKVDPLTHALRDFDAWISGRKRSQGGERKALDLFERENGKLKVNPLANWTREQIRDYMLANDLPSHPLVARGYLSIGCRPCTTPVAPGEPERAGRWRGRAKTECGIHNRPRKTEHARTASA